MMSGMPPMQLPPGGLPPPQFAQQFRPMPPGMPPQQGIQAGGGPFGGQQYPVGYLQQMQQMPGVGPPAGVSPQPRVGNAAPGSRPPAGLEQPVGPPGSLPSGFLPQQQQPGSPQQPQGAMFQSPVPSRGPSRGHSASGPPPQGAAQSPYPLQQGFASQVCAPGKTSDFLIKASDVSACGRSLSCRLQCLHAGGDMRFAALGKGRCDTVSPVDAGAAASDRVWAHVRHAHAAGRLWRAPIGRRAFAGEECPPTLIQYVVIDKT